MKLFIINFILHLCCVCDINVFVSAIDNSYIGCRYSDVCSAGERCVDDKLFGICKPDDSLYIYEYDIDNEFAAVLDEQISKLIGNNYGWKDLYTQCTLKTLLVQYREKLDYDTSNCGTPNNDASDFETRLKRDELIRLHKYFVDDESLKPRDELLRRETIPDIERFSIPAIDVSYEDPDVDERDASPYSSTTDYQPNPSDDDPEDVVESDQALDDYLEQETEEEEKEKEAEMLHDFEEKLEREELRYIKDKLIGKGHGGEYLTDDANSQKDLKERAQFAVEERKTKKTDHPVSRKNSKETANQNRLASRSGNAISRTRVSSEDPKKALAQLELTKRLLAKRGDVAVIDKNWIWIKFSSLELNSTTAPEFLQFLGEHIDPILRDSPYEINRNGKEIDIKVSSAMEYSSLSAEAILKKLKNITNNVPKYNIEDCGLGRKNHLAMRDVESSLNSRNFVLTAVICGSVLATVVIMVALFFLQKHKASMDKLKEVAKTNPFADESSDSYKELCRQRMDTKNTDKTSPTVSGPGAASIRTSSSSWSEEPVQTNMDISTGHMILSYMEEHLKNRDKLEAEWQVLKAYETENVSSEHANKSFNLDKNRFQDSVPFDHNRVVLKKPTSSGSDYINASYVVDHDPKKPSYILTQGPLVNTVSDFWQMVWEQGSLVIVCLTRLSENGMSLCFKYWPEEGSSLFNKYEVHLVSEHVWCEDYLVRSFYLKNIDSGETRTVTQFHFLNWPELSVPANPKSILDFRRKVNKSFRGKQSPIIVHCSDGCGRSGTFTLLDMILNRTNKGVKEIDIAATLEHLRDQRCDVVKSKDQFEFVLNAIAEEVNAVLKALPQ